MKQTLIRIAEAMGPSALLWGLGGSMALNLRGLDILPNDIDIFVSENDFAQARTICSTLGSLKDSGRTSRFCSSHYQKFVIDGVNVDLIGDFRIVCDFGVYHYPFDAQSIDTYVRLDQVDIPVMRLFDWYVLYTLMERDAVFLDTIASILWMRHPIKPETSLRLMKGLPLDFQKKLMHSLQRAQPEPRME